MILSRIVAFFASNISIKMISVLIAVVMWFVVLGSRNYEVTKEIPIEIVASDDLVPANTVPDRVAFRLAGPKAFLRTILDRNDPPIKVNLAGAKAGLTTYRFFADNIKIPIGVKVVSINPTSIAIKLEKVRQKKVPVRIDLQGKLPEGYQLGQIEVIPPEVMIKGPRSRVNSVSELTTLPIDVSGFRQTNEEIAPLDLSGVGVELDGPLPKIRIPIQVVKANFRIKNVKVRVIADHEARFKPKTVTVFVQAAQSDLNSLDQNQVFAEIDLKGQAKGSYVKELKIQLPPQIGFVKVVPDRVKITLY